MTPDRFNELTGTSVKGAQAAELLKSEFWIQHLKPKLLRRPLEFDRVWFDPKKRNKDESAENAIFNSGRHAEISITLEMLEAWVSEGLEADKELARWKKDSGVTPQ